MSSSPASSPSSSRLCDTLPAPRFASLQHSLVQDPSSGLDHSRSGRPQPDHSDIASLMLTNTGNLLDPQTDPDIKPEGSQLNAQPTRKLCVRHQRMADEGTNLKLQQSLDALPLQEREAVNAIWSSFSSSSHPRRALILQGLLTMCCFSQLSLLAEQLSHLIRIDPFAIFPREVSLKVLTHLDATSLCRAAQVSKSWKDLADDNILWLGICKQHIGQKCLKCGWGLPILDKKRGSRLQSLSPRSSPGISSPSPSPSTTSLGAKRVQEARSCSPDRPLKRQRSEPFPVLATSDRYLPPSPSFSPPPIPVSSPPPQISITRPWKDVYSERLKIERNWRRGRCSVRTLKGHTDGVMCLQFADSLSHGPSCSILITGSYDFTARVWNLETGAELRCLQGHRGAVRALQFDAVKLITGSMDHTIRVWNWREGRCVRTLAGHEGGVVCLNFDSNVLATGGVDAKIKVWNLRTQEAFTLRGHTDWVNAVQLWDSNDNVPPTSDASLSSMPVFEPTAIGVSLATAEPHIDPGKMLFSASDDGTIRLWDLTLRNCVRQFTGHVAQVQSMKLQVVDDECNGIGMAAKYSQLGVERQQVTSSSSREEPQQDLETATTRTPLLPGSDPRFLHHTNGTFVSSELPSHSPNQHKRSNPVLISGSLDNTIKLWDIDTGKTLQTFFGHIEGVWTVASDKLRLVSGSHDRTIKVWVREEDHCTATLFGHRGAVTCLALGEDKIISGSDDNDVKIWSFSG